MEQNRRPAQKVGRKVSRKLKPYFTKGILEAGCDEAGRGCLAGPVVASAVILPEKFNLPLLNDSKQLSEQKRLTLRTQIEEQALAFKVAFVSPEKIDEINILWASIYAMHLALDDLPQRPEHILVDGNKFKPYPFTPHTCVVKGDSKYASIAAASILAKTYRDEYMEKLHVEFPHYDWNNNKGYPTAKHKARIQANGTTIHHRKSFKLT